MRRAQKGHGLRALLWLNFFVGDVQSGLDCDGQDCMVTEMVVGEWNGRLPSAPKDRGKLSGGGTHEK
jgi:hypothetical protein